MNVGFFSHTAAALVYLLLTLVSLTRWRGKQQGFTLALACIVTTFWAGVVAVQAAYHTIPVAVIWSLEILRSGIWLIFLVRILNYAMEADTAEFKFFRFITYEIAGLTTLLLGLVWLQPLLAELGYLSSVGHPQMVGHVVLALTGMALVEQFYRNTRPEQRWHIKFLCFALGGMFAYDFYLYTNALLLNRISGDLWMGRGGVLVLLAPLFAISMARNPGWALDIFVSRNIVFHTATLLTAGSYLLLMSVVGYYIKFHGGEWGAFVQIVFLAGAFLVLLLLLFSGQIRAKLRVFLSKHFFNYAYDYREVWLKLIRGLSEKNRSVPLEERVIGVLADLVESPSGVLWVGDKQGDFVWRANYRNPAIEISKIRRDDALVEFIRSERWVVNLNEIERLPELYKGMARPFWLEDYANPWLFVPLFQDDNLIGIVLLNQPRTAINWNWEVIDLLRTSGRQAASYLALKEAAGKLAEAQQFEGFNRLSAFVIHDLKNLIAQLSLIVRNAEKHLDNPDFVKDAIGTVDHAVTKMSRLMSQLKNAKADDCAVEVNLDDAIKEAIKSRASQLPVPVFKNIGEKSFKVTANADRLASAFEHVIHNAQDATDKSGFVRVSLQTYEDQAIVEIEDNGCGMNIDFIRSRLFKPFETTKGLTGMGIGAYECREYIRSLGGDVEVMSIVGEGSRFSFRIPSKTEEIQAELIEVAQ